MNKLGRLLSFVALYLRLKLFYRRATKEQIVRLAVNNGFLKSYQLDSELLAFAKIVAEARPQSILEIGTFKGGTLFMLTRLASPDATIISLDLGLSRLRDSMIHGFAIERQVVHLIRGDSHRPEQLERVRCCLPNGNLDLLFIDGDHTYDGVKQDFELYAPLVRPGGMVVFHDIAEHPPEAQCEVARFWNGIKHSFHHQEIIADRNQGWAGIGVLFIGPPADSASLHQA